MESFARAADGGFASAQLNLASLYAKVGLTKLAQDARTKVKGVPGPGELLPGVSGAGGGKQP
jgi:hypothetical protein